MTQTSQHHDTATADQVAITCYTDPLCCWSWALEPHWRRLQYQFRGHLTARYVMSGMLPGWKNYNDPVHSISRPLQMGPLWLEAATESGMPIHDKIWVEDPPASSYPACIAVKCAGLQSPDAANLYLRLARQAVMMHGANIARQEVLVEIARQLAQQHPHLLNVDTFAHDLVNGRGIEAFRSDWQEVQSRNINRFPTLIFRAAGLQPIMLTGYRPYPLLLQALQHVAPSLTPQPIDIDAYKSYWGYLTAAEVAAVSTPNIAANTKVVTSTNT